MNQNLSAFQERRWTLDYYFNEYKEGWLIMFRECLEALKRVLKRRSKQQQHPTNGTSGAQSRPKNYATTNERSSHESIEKGGGSEELASIACGLNTIAKMLNCTSLFLPAFLLAARPGLVPTKSFVRFNYLFLASTFVFIAYINKNLVEPTLINTLPATVKPVTKLLADVAILIQNVIVIFGLGCLIAILKLRCPLQDFVLFHCNIISLPKSYQRRKAVSLFLTFYLLTLFSKPAFVSLMLTFDPAQPRQLSNWTQAAFWTARWMMVTVVACSSSIFCFSAMIIPLLTCYLIVCSAAHLNRSLEKQISRFARIDGIDLGAWKWHKSKRNEQLECLLDDKTRRLIHDYSCDTITCDWPDLMPSSDGELEGGVENEAQNNSLTGFYGSFSQNRLRSKSLSKLTNLFENIRGSITYYLTPSGEPPVKVQRSSSSQDDVSSPGRSANTDRAARFPETSPEYLKSSNEPSKEARQKSDPESMKSATNLISCYQFNARYSSTSNGLLFIHKNLIKSLSELKGMIAIYERRFGSFHLLQICLDSLIVAQWVTTSLTEMRLKDELKIEQLSNRTLSQMDGAAISKSRENERPSTLFWLSSMGVISFVLVNTYIFMTCDCLPDSMVKMRSKLFKMNVDLACTALRQHAHLQNCAGSVQSPLGGPARSSLAEPLRRESACWSPFQKLSGGKSKRSNSVTLIRADDYAELDQVWSLYDQVVRLSELANFRLTTGTYYSKRCLLWIFGRTVSLTLLCIQIVDIYSYS